MSWVLQADKNSGYPTNTNFPSSYTSGWTDPMPWVWRIDRGVNDGYPYRHIWFPNSGGGGSGTQFDIGGRQTNYPNGFHQFGVSNLIYDTAGFDFNSNPDIGQWMSSMVNAWTCKPDMVKWIKHAFAKAPKDLGNAAVSVISQATGGLYNCLVSAKMFPFIVPDAGGVAPTSVDILEGGLWSLIPDSVPPCDDGYLPLYPLTNTTVLLDFGAIDLGIRYAWEVESIDWSIYLPFCGTFPLDIRSNEGLHLRCLVDLMTGNCEYYLTLVKQFTTTCEELIFTTSGKMGVEIPFNLNQAAIQQNLMGWRNNEIGKGLSLISQPLMMSGNPYGMIAGAAAGAVGSAVQSISQTSHQNITAPSMGGGVCFGADLKPRVIARVPRLHFAADGYPDIIGINHSMIYNHLSEVGIGEYTKCREYKCDIILATTEEKAEIEKLMNSGVFV